MAKDTTQTDIAKALAKMLPEDLQDYSTEKWAGLIKHAVYLRRVVPWCAEYPMEMFLQYVVCPRVNDEDLCFQQDNFFEMLWPEVQRCSSVLNAALTVNNWCATYARYTPTDDRTANPWNVFVNGIGRCGELSTFVVYCLRCVGIAARQVYVPKWSHCDDNHAWVEFLDKRSWLFMGACEPSNFANAGWFQNIATRAVVTRTRVFGPVKSPTHGEFLETHGNVSFYCQNKRYLPSPVTRCFNIRLGKAPAANATVRLQVLNEGSLQTVAELTADEFGRAFLDTRDGDIWISASKDGLYTEAVSSDSEVWLNLERPAFRSSMWSQPRVFKAPTLHIWYKPFSQENKDRELKLRREIEKSRETLMELQQKDHPLNPDVCKDLLLAAKGNDSTIKIVLSVFKDRGEKLLRVLPEKDLQDTPCDVLTSHLFKLPPQGSIPDSVYWRYLASPRLNREKLAAWREPEAQAVLARHLTASERKVMELRLQGVPARLRPLDGVPEQWNGSSFQPAEPEETGTLLLSCPVEIPDNLWSLSKYQNGAWVRLNPYQIPCKDGIRRISLTVGEYRLLSTKRTRSGDVKYAMFDFTITKGCQFRAPLMDVCLNPEELIMHRSLTPVYARLDTKTEDVIRDIFCVQRNTLVLWFQQMDEPAVHLMQELIANAKQLVLKFPSIFLFVQQPDKYRIYYHLQKAIPTMLILKGNFEFDSQETARSVDAEPDVYPLLVAGDGAGHAYFAQAGYNVGTVSSLLAARELSPSSDFYEDARNLQGGYGWTGKEYTHINLHPNNIKNYINETFPPAGAPSAPAAAPSTHLKKEPANPDADLIGIFDPD